MLSHDLSESLFWLLSIATPGCLSLLSHDLSESLFWLLSIATPVARPLRLQITRQFSQFLLSALHRSHALQPIFAMHVPNRSHRPIHASGRKSLRFQDFVRPQHYLGSIGAINPIFNEKKREKMQANKIKGKTGSKSTRGQKNPKFIVSGKKGKVRSSNPYCPC